MRRRLPKPRPEKMNRIEFNTEEVSLPFRTKAAGRFIRKVLSRLGLDNWDLSVFFCSNRYIKSLNAKYRSKDEATDVLSFPLGEMSPGGRFLAGDIVVSLDALKENAGFFNVSENEELRRLLVHGILHLMGEDHKTNGEGESMLVTQEEILAHETEKII